MSKPLTLRRTTSGLTNQKLGILGVLLAAHWRGVKAVIPDTLYDFYPRDEKGKQGRRVDVNTGDVLDVGRLGQVCDVGDPASAINHKNAFRHGSSAFFAGVGDALRLMEYIKSSARVVEAAREISGMIATEYDCVQLRIESDFAVFRAQNIRRGHWTKDTAPEVEALDILNRIKAMGAQSPVYACCDEQDLPVTKEELKALASGMELIFRSDIAGPLDGVSRLEGAAIDYELILQSRTYFGLRVSTMSRLALHERNKGKLKTEFYT